MRIAVIGKDYFAERFALLLKNMGMDISSIPRFTRTSIRGYDMICLSGKDSTSRNILASLRENSHVFSEQFIFDRHYEIGAVDFARENSLKLQPGFFDIFSPVAKEIRQLIRRQRIFSLLFRTLGPRQAGPKLNIIDDLVIQNIGILNYLLDGKPEIANASSRDIFSTCFLHLRKGNSDAFIYANNETLYKERMLSIFGQGMVIHADMANQRLHFLDSDTGKPSLTGTGYEGLKELFIRKSEPLSAALKTFVESKSNPMDYEAIKQNLDTVYRIKRSMGR